ncbi:PREDICTED: uncharacterized protein LOC109228573 [Nicotiana attenuata]|uniref:uncharacterized protein LOC109228573 n=1 Tax=Nicotiana attenuata TaxID=49451 RepID=UPI000905A623|nr:PREDICTED: uncharacterized protein LOC109228573 [Nicotiana attenuata]
MRLYHRGAAFCKKMRGKLSKMSEKRNIRDHKRRLLAAKYELRRKLYKALCKDPDLPSDMRDKHRYKLSKLARKSSFARVRNRCIYTGRPRSVYDKNFSYPFSWISISRSFDGHKEIFLVPKNSFNYPRKTLIQEENFILPGKKILSINRPVTTNWNIWRKRIKILGAFGMAHLYVEPAKVQQQLLLPLLSTNFLLDTSSSFFGKHSLKRVL